MKYLILISLLISSLSFSKETRKKIIVIDTGYTRYQWSNLPINSICENGLLDVTGTGPQDNLGHGSNIIGLIANGIDYKSYCIVSIKWYDESLRLPDFFLTRIIERAIRLAESLNPYLINMSSSGKQFNAVEQLLISRMTYKGVKVVVSAGNDSLDLSQGCIVYPACYKANSINFYVVGGVDKYNKFFSMTNRSGPVKYYEEAVNKCAEGFCLSGTSQAAAIKSNKLIRGIK